jgi:hypothetical protein
MNSSVYGSWTLRRDADVEKTETSVSIIDGMPPMMEVKQRKNGTIVGRVSVTMSEAKYLRYLMSEFETFIRLGKRVDERDDDDD